MKNNNDFEKNELISKIDADLKLLGFYFDPPHGPHYQGMEDEVFKKLNIRIAENKEKLFNIVKKEFETP